MATKFEKPTCPLEGENEKRESRINSFSLGRPKGAQTGPQPVPQLGSSNKFKRNTKIKTKS
jgi:hypothetical protein